MLLSSIVIVLSSCGKKEDEREAKYNEALALIDGKDYEGAYDILNTLGDYKDTEKLLSRFYNSLVETVRERDGTQRITTSEYALMYVPYDLAEDVKSFVIDASGGIFTED